MFLTRVKSSDDSTSKQILLPRLDENESRSYSIAAASMKNAYSPSSFLTFQMHCFIRMFSSYSPDWAMGMFLDAIASPCSYLCQSVSAVGQWVGVTSQNVVVFIKIIITLSKPSLLLLVITLGFVDSMKAFNLAYVGMVELCRDGD